MKKQEERIQVMKRNQVQEVRKIRVVNLMMIEHIFHVLQQVWKVQIGSHLKNRLLPDTKGKQHKIDPFLQHVHGKLGFRICNL